MKQPQETFGWRTGLSMSFLVVACWTAARLASREEYQWLLLLIVPGTGFIVGGVYRQWIGSAIGFGLGLGMAVFLIFYDGVLWLVFTLPPHPKIDL
jgi:hypothetical protein